MKKNNDQISKKDSPREYRKNFKKELEKDKSIIYYKFNKPGNVKQECPIAMKFSKFSKKKKGKAMKVIWSDRKNNSSKKDEEVE